jgi:hypothetical protein
VARRFANDEVNRLHAEAFETEGFSEDEWNGRALASARVDSGRDGGRACTPARSRDGLG